MNTLFSPLQIKGIQLKNRTVRSATWLGLADAQGAPTSDMIDRLETLARKGLSLIVTGHAHVSSNGRSSVRQLSMADDGLIVAHAKLVEALHRHGTPVVIQLSHGGAYAKEKLSGEPPVCFGQTEWTPKGCQTLTQAGIDALLESFVKASLRAKLAGYDAIQLHGAHGYLISQSLSPLFNAREDAYGGSVTLRNRFVVELISSIRSAIGPGMPILMKINCEDYEMGGVSLADQKVAIPLWELAGLDAIEISGGLLTSRYLGPTRLAVKPAEGEAYFRKPLQELRLVTRLPLILVGGLRSPEVCEELLAQGEADLVAFSRPLICQPDLVARWQQGDRLASRCLSDNRCFRPGMVGKGVYCETFANP